MSQFFTTEVRDNFTPPTPQKPKPSRKEVYIQKAYEETARNVLIQHEMKQKQQAQERLISDYMQQFSQASPAQTDFSHHYRHPLYSIDDAITIWSVNKATKPPTIRKQTKFSRPISEQLDQQFG